MKTFTPLTLLLTLSMSHLVLASNDSPDEENSIVQARIQSLGSLIPVTPPSPLKEPKKIKRNFSLSLKLSSSSIKKDKDDSSSSSASPRSGSPKKLDTLQSPSSPRLRGFSYTAGSSPHSCSVPSLTQVDLQPLSASLEDDKMTDSAKSSSEASKPDSIKSPRGRTNSFKKDVCLSAPVAKTAFVTIKDPEAELNELLQTALTLCGSALEPLNETHQDSNSRVELVVKPMDAKERSQKLGDPVSFFRMTVDRAMTQIPSAVKWALEEPLENTDMIKYFEKMFEDAQKTQEAILHEHSTTKLTLMQLGQALFLALTSKEQEQKSNFIEGRKSVVDAFLKEYTTYVNGMHTQLSQATGKPISFNSLNRDFNLTIHLMHANLLKVLEWAIGKEDGIDAELQLQLSKKLEEFTAPLSSSSSSSTEEFKKTLLEKDDH